MVIVTTVCKNDGGLHPPPEARVISSSSTGLRSATPALTILAFRLMSLPIMKVRYLVVTVCHRFWCLLAVVLLLFGSFSFGGSGSVWASSSPTRMAPDPGSLGARNAAVNRPVINENFIGKDASLDPQIAFSRNSAATLIGPSGLLQSVGSDVPRFDYDPKTLALNGLLLEQGTTNQQLDSDFSIFPGGVNRWYASSASLTFDSALAPDGYRHHGAHHRRFSRRVA